MDYKRKEGRTSPPTIAIALKGAVVRVYLVNCLIKVKAGLVAHVILGSFGWEVYLGFTDINRVCLCILSDQGGRRLLRPYQRSLAS